MNIKEAMTKCAAECNFKSCEECGVYGDSECWMHLSGYLLNKCMSCKETTYYYVNDCNEIEKIAPKFCPECGRAL